jgi:hypothetical protein
MSFHEIVNSTATIPYDINDNFLYVAQGSITPKTGAMLEETTSTINIGSSTNRWNKGYFSGDIFSNVATIAANKTFLEVTSIELSAATSKIDITGLNGDTDCNYFIVASFMKPSNGGEYVRLWVNGDSNASNYFSKSFQYVNPFGPMILDWNFAMTGILNGPGEPDTAFINLTAKTGTPRAMSTKHTDIRYFSECLAIYGDTTTTITSIIFEPSTGTFGTLSSIDIYCYGLD